MEFETGQRYLWFYPHNRRITDGETKENRRAHNHGIRFWIFTERSRKCSRKCLRNDHTFVERLVCLAGSYVRLKNIWPSKPRDNRSGTEAKLHRIFKSVFRAVWLGSWGSAGLLFGSPGLGGKARHGKGSGRFFFYNRSNTAPKPKVPWLRHCCFRFFFTETTSLSPE